jgi:hypothetical protein
MVKLEVILCILFVCGAIYFLDKEHANTVAVATPSGIMAPANTPGKHFTAYIDPAFTPEQEREVISALQEWEQAVVFDGPRFEIVHEDITCNPSNCGNAIALHPDTQKHITEMLNREGLKGTFYGATYPWDNGAANSYIGSDMSLWQFHYTALHEIGHSLGLDHNNKAPGVMCQSSDCMTHHVSIADVMQYKVVQAKR